VTGIDDGVLDELPRPFGQPAATETMGSVAAPLLAGFAFTSVGLILQAEDHLRWPDQTLVLMVCAALLLITSMQAAFNARRHWIPPAEWASWIALTSSSARRDLIWRRVAEDLCPYARWAALARLTYNLAIVLLLAALALLLIPRGSIAGWRLAAIGLATVGALGELCWVIAAYASRGRSPASITYEPDLAHTPSRPTLRPSGGRTPAGPPGPPGTGSPTAGRPAGPER
jgi:hypothetical protein